MRPRPDATRPRPRPNNLASRPHRPRGLNTPDLHHARSLSTDKLGSWPKASILNQGTDVLFHEKILGNVTKKNNVLLGISLFMKLS